MKVLAACALLLSGYVAVIPNGGGYIGSASDIEAAANAARRCGIRQFRIASQGRETRLFLRRGSRRSGGARCLSRWVAANLPDLGLVVMGD